MSNRIATYRSELAAATPEEVIRWAARTFPGRTALTSSFGPEDQVLVALAAPHARSMRIVTLDTGRLFPETYDLMHETSIRYGVDIEVFFPDAADIESMVAEEGINLFRTGTAARKRCCEVRKVRPLRRALRGMDAWITGLRRDQSETRGRAEVVEWDEDIGLVKIDPLVDWSEADVWRHIREHDVPFSVLHERGFRSIGCAPCTRAVLPGEDERAGRWWWESPDEKECGLHRRPDEAAPDVSVSPLAAGGEA
ncbi:MAG: phosphoadenylyl-sulfate reductase [Coriobacteriia bacterium]|nr:phosphoadenylyl-sulfate reductase [Coriobacteriia bacterium]